MQLKSGKTETNKGQNKRRKIDNRLLTTHLLEFVQLYFPDVVSNLIVSYNYHFKGILDGTLAGERITQQVCGFPDGRIVALVGYRVRIWDGITGNTLWKGKQLFCHGGVQKVKVLPSDMFLVLYTDNEIELALFDSNTYDRLVSFPFDDHPIVEVLQPDDIEEDDTVRIVSFDRGRETKHLQFFAYKRGAKPIPPQQLDLEAQILSVSALPNNRFVIVTQCSDESNHRIYVFQCVANKISQVCRQEFSTQHTLGDLASSTITSDGGLLAWGSCYNWTTSQRRGYLSFFKDMNLIKEIVLEDCSCVISAFFLSQQSRVLCVSNTNISIYDWATGNKELTLCKYDSCRHCFALLPNDDLVVSDTCACEATDLEVYNTATGVKSGTIHIAEPHPACAKQNGHVSVATCKPEKYRTVDAGLSALPDGRLACAGYGLRIYR